MGPLLLLEKYLYLKTEASQKHKRNTLSCLWVLKENLRKTIEEEYWHFICFHSALKFLSENKWWFYKVVLPAGCCIISWTFCDPSVLLDAAFGYGSLKSNGEMRTHIMWNLESQILGNNTDWWGAKSRQPGLCFWGFLIYTCSHSSSH